MLSALDDSRDLIDGDFAGYDKASYHAGYSTAVCDHMASVLELAESFLAQRPAATPEQRQLILAFVGDVFGHVPQPRALQYFNDGLGI